LDIESIVEDLFKIDKNIRYVGVVDEEFRLLASSMREGKKTMTSEQFDREFMSVVPPVIVGGAHRLREFCGALKGMVIRYEKVAVAFYPIAHYVAILSLEPEVEMPFLDKTAAAVQEVMKRIL